MSSIQDARRNALLNDALFGERKRVVKICGYCFAFVEEFSRTRELILTEHGICALCRTIHGPRASHLQLRRMVGDKLSEEDAEFLAKWEMYSK